MPRDASPLPEHLGGVFTVAGAREAGVSRGRLRLRDLESPHRGVRVVKQSCPDNEQDEDPLARDRAARSLVLARARAFEPVRPAGAFYIGRTAVVIHDRFFDSDDGSRPLEVAVLAPGRAPRARGILGRQLAPQLTSQRVVEGLPVASPAATWAGLATELSVVELVKLGDALVRIPRGAGGVPLPAEQRATVAQLRAAADVPRRVGRAQLHAALERIRVGSMSPLETDYRLAAQDAGLPEAELDCEIRDDRGSLLGIGDLVHTGPRVVVEVEGQHHRTSRAQWERDIEKHAALVATGWEVVRVTRSHIRSGQAVARVRDALARRGGS